MRTRIPARNPPDKRPGTAALPGENARKSCECRMTLFRLLPLLLLPLFLSACDERWGWRQKVTVTVETPQGERVGTSVLAGSLRYSNSSLPEASGAFISLRGEAVVVEVAPGRYLFALLGGMPTPFPVFFPGEAPVEMAGRLEDLRDVREVPPDLYPLLVAFDDVADPKTVRRVDPSDLAASFGPGVALTSVTLEITDEAVTKGRVEPVLGWIETVGDGMLDGKQFSSINAENRLANDLTRIDFVRP